MKMFSNKPLKRSGQIQRIDDVYALLKKDDLIQTYKEQILGAYKEVVDPKTRKNKLSGSSKILNDYKYALETFFGGKGGFKQIEKIGELAKVEAIIRKK